MFHAIFLKDYTQNGKEFQALCRWHVIAQIKKMVQKLKSDHLQI